MAERIKTSLSQSDITSLDRQHVWHPYESCETDNPIYPVASADGVHLTLCSGEKLIDGMSSWWSAIHGYNHPRLNAAIEKQLKNMAHVMFGGLTHEPAVTLAKTLVDLTPDGLNRVFFSDSGSVAVEVALKIALQYWAVKHETQRNTFVSLRKGYHGDTFGAMSVCDPVTGMHQLFAGYLMQNIFADSPQCGFGEDWHDAHMEDFENTLLVQHETIAAVILEPIVQGAGGMRFYSPIFLQKVRKLCTKYNILLIADEIATGFGRTGRMFACEHADISPDILCLGKALTGGYMSLAATLTTDDIASTLSKGSPGVLMHGPTFMANALACAVANESIALLTSSDWQKNISNIEDWLTQGLAPCWELPNVVEVRVLGAIGVVELVDAVDMKTIQPLFVERGIWLRPFGKLVYMMPPYICSQAQIQELTKQAVNVLKKCLQ
jgi:adenosylmethionine-8-amino-7-oxononanoate aminotransferase